MDEWSPNKYAYNTYSKSRCNRSWQHEFVYQIRYIKLFELWVCFTRSLMHGMVSLMFLFYALWSSSSFDMDFRTFCRFCMILICLPIFYLPILIDVAFIILFLCFYIINSYLACRCSFLATFCCPSFRVELCCFYLLGEMRNNLLYFNMWILYKKNQQFRFPNDGGKEYKKVQKII